jgi:diguanylate cyclase (GGDEF)-like protein/PAS domain S-box-containing protein
MDELENSDPLVSSPPIHRRAELARQWTASTTSVVYIPKPPEAVEELLLGFLDQLLDSLVAPEFSLTAGLRVGDRLVAEGFSHPDALGRTLDVLTAGLLGDVGTTPDTELARRTAALLGALSTGFADALRRHTLDQQETLNQALSNAVRRAETNLRAIEQRFQEVFASSAIGIAITDLDGMCVEVNPSLGLILGREPDRLVGHRLAELLRADGVGDVMAGYRRILDGTLPRFSEQRKVRRGNGEPAWVLLAVSLLRDGAGEPAYFVTMVQDVTELQLLQDRLGHQLLYDALTGLPNRQCFHSKLETTLESAPPGATVTLCCLNLDGFAVLNNSLGHKVGDQLLRAVARRLELVVGGENALVARIGGDEFAVLVVDSSTPADIGELTSRINQELSEPEYLGDHGVALGASIGAIRRRADELPADELFRAADFALRKAKRTGRRQWAGYHDGDDVHGAQLDRYASELPAAWEDGALGIGFEPVVRLADRAPVGARIVLSWPEADHETCLWLAERTGLSVHLGPSIMRSAALELAGLRPLFDATHSVLRLQLTRNQSGDADLVRAVTGALKESGVAPAQFEISLDTRAVLEEFGDARDNLEVLTDIGVSTGLCGFNGGPRELVLVAETGVRSVTLAADGVGAAGRESANPLLRKETTHLVAAVAEAGATCSVIGVADEAEAGYWTSAGATTAQGGMFGAGVAADALAELVTSGTATH